MPSSQHISYLKRNPSAFNQDIQDPWLLGVV